MARSLFLQGVVCAPGAAGRGEEAMYEIYLIRHAISEERGPAWPDDDRRPLTREGIRRFKDVVRALGALDVELDMVVTSPLTRARQTADLLSTGLRGCPKPKQLPGLAPGTPPAEVVAALLGVIKGGRLAAVGHEPDLGEVAAFLIGSERPLSLKKGGICRIDVPSRVPPTSGTLVWFAPPKLFRPAGRRR